MAEDDEGVEIGESFIGLQLDLPNIHAIYVPDGLPLADEDCRCISIYDLHFLGLVEIAGEEAFSMIYS